MAGDLDAALADLNELVAIDPAHYLDDRAEVHLAARRTSPDQVIADIDQLLPEPQAIPAPLCTAHERYAIKGEWVKAAADIDSAITKSKSLMNSDGFHWREDWQVLRGTVMAHNGRFEEAADAFEVQPRRSPASGRYLGQCTPTIQTPAFPSLAMTCASGWRCHPTHHQQ